MFQRFFGNSDASRLTRVSLSLTLLILFGAAFLSVQLNFFSPRPSGDRWQAVFLANGQVYFGKLELSGRDYVTLTNIYYLQAPQGLQQAPAPDAAPPNLNLVKLGAELHGPEDRMVIAQDQVLFWEDLKDSSKVVQAIANAQNR